MPVIKSIMSALPMDGTTWVVGTEFGEGKTISKIVDSGYGFEDHVFIQYDIYVNNKIWKSLINMPVIVEYELEG